MERLHTILVALGAFAMLCVACNKPTVGIYTYDIDYEEQATIDTDRHIRFADLVEDSRCPIDVDCIVAGRAVIGLEYIDGSEDGIPFQLALDVDNPEAADTVLVGKYDIELLEVFPIPVSTEDPQPEEYTIRLKVEIL